MALILLNNVGQPFGQFDGYDGLTATLLGGEVAKLIPLGFSSTDKKVKDIDDGYTVSGSPLAQNVRPVVSTTMSGSEAVLTTMFFLTDDGTTNYGTLFGSVVGGLGGQQITGGAVLGPSTMTGSGKVTLWQNPGLYGVTMDALDTVNLNASSNVTVGTELTYTTGGKLTPQASAADAGGPTVANLIEFSTGDGLVNTPRSLTRVGVAGGMLQFKYAVINWTNAKN